jgi:hypothetical protein
VVPFKFRNIFASRLRIGSNVVIYRFQPMKCTCPPHTQINLVLFDLIDLVNLIKLFVFHYYFGSRLSDNAGDLIHEEHNITL